MKIVFRCDIEENFRHYAGDPELGEDDYSREFIIDWNETMPLPRKGDMMRFDHLMENNNEPWAEVFYGRIWEVDYAVWEYNPSEGKMTPEIWMKDGEK